MRHFCPAHIGGCPLNRLLPDAWKRELEKGFPRYSLIHLKNCAEEAASLGIGITLLLLAAVVAHGVRRVKINPPGQAMEFHPSGWPPGSPASFSC